MDMTLKAFAKSIKKRAKKAGVSLNKLCIRAGIDRSTFTKWDNGTVTNANNGSTKAIENAICFYESAL